MNFSSRIYAHFLTTAGLVMLVGCTSYHPRALPAAPDLAQAPSLTVSTATLDVPGLRAHIVPSDGLDETTVMILAVLNNPNLKAARLQAGVASAQVLQAGLLPDPQFGASLGTSALNWGGALGLSEDLQAILTRGAAKAAARASAKQVNLSILWQEIQVAERAREVFIQQQSDSELEQVLSSNQALAREAYERDRRAMEHDDATSATVSADLVVLSDAETAVRQVQTDINVARHQLNALLGIVPDAKLHLVGSGHVEAVPKADFDQAVADLPRRRADLLALQAGYQSQEETLRRAVLAQFPAMSAGVNYGRDPVEGVNSFGPEVSLTLPIFNRNRGQIAVDRATREVLRQRYQAQLDAAVGQANEVWKATEIMKAQLRELDAQLPFLRTTEAAAEQSFRQSNLNAAMYVSARSALLTKQAEAIRLQASLENARSSLSTLLGLPFDTR